MTDQKIIATCVVSVIVLLGGGGYLAIRMASPKASVADVPPDVAAPAGQSKPALQSPPKPTPAPAVSDQQPLEIQRLRIENEQLRDDLQAMKLATQRQQQEAQRQRQETQQRQQQAAAENAPPSLEEVESIGKKLAPMIEARFEQIKEEGNKVHPVQAKETLHFKMESADLVRTDSVANPIAGQIVFDSFSSYEGDGFGGYSEDKYTVRIAKRNGKWVMISGSSKCETDHSFPQTEYSHNRTGETKTLSPEWLKDELISLQR